VGLYKLTHSLKAPRFNPSTYQVRETQKLVSKIRFRFDVISWFQSLFSNSTCTALRNGTGFNPDNETEWLLFAEQVFRLEGEQEQVEYATFDKNLESSTRLMRPDTAYMYRPSDTGYPDGKGACYNRMSWSAATRRRRRTRRRCWWGCAS
jgi:hypothetical protein